MTGKTGILAVGIALCALAIWFLCGRSAAAEAVYPVQNGIHRATRTAKRYLDAVFTRVTSASETERLRLENAALRLTCADLEQLATENARLRELLELGSATSRFSTNRWICAQVLSQGAASGVPGMIRLGQGSFAGVKAGAVVAVPEGLVGRVVAVSPHTSDVRLMSDPKMRIACEVETDDATQGPVRGIISGGGLHTIAQAGATFLYVVNPLRIKNLGRHHELPARAKIITSGLGGVFPRGLVVGYLLDGMSEDDDKLEREGDVAPAVDLPNLDFVFIRRER